MSEQASILESLRGASLFEGISESALEAISGITLRRNYEEGDSIYELGDDAAEVYVVESGRVRFSLGVGNRAGVSGSIITKGQIFGWAALLDDQPRRVATASCLENSTVLVIDGRQLLEAFESNTDAGYLVMRRLAAMIAANFMEVLTN
ncbi:MAG: cyclic nucleotide-binding domain-containing protein [Methyloligellaceae bacterium]